MKEISRRDFLRWVSMAGGGALLAACSPSPEPTSTALPRPTARPTSESTPTLTPTRVPTPTSIPEPTPNPTPEPQPVFKFIQEYSRNDDTEMYGNFNMGAGFAVFIPEQNVFWA